MPIYEYLCESCGSLYEVMQKVTDRPPAKCRECGSRRLAKLMSRTAFQLKGGGWYADLYSSKRKEGGSEAAPAEGGAEPKAEEATSGKSAGRDRPEAGKDEPKAGKDKAEAGKDKPREGKPARKAGKAGGG